MKYQVGDKARVRQWEEMAEEFGLTIDGLIKTGNWYFNDMMRVFCGKELEIIERCEDYYITKGNGYRWSDSMFEDITSIKDSGERTTFETGAVRDLHAGKGRMDLLPFHAILELSKHCENGAIKYEEHNVEKGIPQHSLIDSGMRHLFKHAAGYTDEDHLLAALWNIAWAVNQRTTHPELIDVPWKGEEENAQEKIEVRNIQRFNAELQEIRNTSGTVDYCRRSLQRGN